MNLFGWMRVNWKAALACSALGSFFTILGMLVSPLEADRDKFGEIECTKLTVVGDTKEGDFGRVVIGVHSPEFVLPRGGFLAVVGENGEHTELGVNGDGGFVRVSTGNSCGSLAEMGVRKLSNGHLEGFFDQSSIECE